jgi:hypothetical protein
MDSIKSQVIQKIDSRIAELEEHQYDEIEINGNQYSELNQAISKVIGVPLRKELSNLKNFVEKL